MVEVQLFIIVVQLLSVRDADLIHKTRLYVSATHKVVVITISNPKYIYFEKLPFLAAFLLSNLFSAEQLPQLIKYTLHNRQFLEYDFSGPLHFLFKIDGFSERGFQPINSNK